MKKITRFVYLSGGNKCSGVLPGHLNKADIQLELLKQKRGCQRVLTFQFQSVRT